MSDSLTCDNCGRTSPKEGLVGWVHREAVGYDIRAFSEPAADADFCSPRCEVDYVARTYQVDLRDLFLQAR